MKNSIIENLEISDWKFVDSTSESGFSSDDIIDAYYKGKEQGIIDEISALRRIVNSNIKKTINHANSVISYLVNQQIFPEYSYIKLISWDTYEVLISVATKDFLDEKFLKVYEFVTETENKINDEVYELTFSFIDSNTDFDNKKLNSDGFFLKQKFDYSELH